MAKRGSGSVLTEGEKIAGTIFFVIYVAVLPFVTRPALDLLGRMMGVEIGQSLGNTLYYYGVFAVTLILFHRFIGRTTRLFVDGLNESLKTLAMGFVAFYGLNVIVYRIMGMTAAAPKNLNDMTISAQIHAAPRTTVLIVVALAPFVEEVLFRGLVFGGIRQRSRFAGYAVSCLLFALLHVWQYAVGSHDPSYLLLTVEYLVPGMVFCWAYEHSGTLWTSIFLHAGVNALSVATLLA